MVNVNNFQASYNPQSIPGQDQGGFSGQNFTVHIPTSDVTVLTGNGTSLLAVLIQYYTVSGLRLVVASV